MKRISIFTLVLVSTTFAFSMSKKPTKAAQTPVTPKVSGKSLGYFHTVLWSEDNGNGDLKVIAKVVARKEMNDADFQWKVPGNVQVLSGDSSGDAVFAAGEEKVFSIVVSKDNLNEKDQFFFFVYEMKSGERHGTSQSFIYSTQDVSKSQQKLKKLPKYYE